MALDKIVEGIASLAGRSVDAKFVTAGILVEGTIALPAVSCEWLRTETETENYSTVTGKRMALNADSRTHTGVLHVLIGASVNGAYDAPWMQIYADRLLDGFRQDERLEDSTGTKLADMVKITSVEPLYRSLGSVVYAALEAEWRAIELR